jgi:hypothetical protein
MNPALNAYLAHELINDQIRQAERFRRGREQARPEPGEPYGSVTVRRYRPADEPAVRHLAEREGRRPPAEPILVAEVCGNVLAARSLEKRDTLAHPSPWTAQLVELLDLRSVQLRQALGTDGARPQRVRRFVRTLSRPIRS